MNTAAKKRAPRKTDVFIDIEARNHKGVAVAFLYQAWFSIETVHGSQLEMVLDAADKRKGEPHRALLHPKGRVTTTYTDSLNDMLKAAFKKSKTRIVERQEYGDLTFLVEAETPAALQSALARCDTVSKRWVNKYRINAMKPEAK